MKEIVGWEKAHTHNAPPQKNTAVKRKHPGMAFEIFQVLNLLR